MTVPDPRHISRGWEIPTESYSDQPYVVITDDGAWLVCLTTGPGHEGAAGQHVATLRSSDRGQSCSTPLPVEPGETREYSYAVMLKAPPDAAFPGRVFIFYNHNTDNVREVRRHDGKPPFQRVDSLGHFVMKHSDDHGRSWSSQRVDLPVREFACDRGNVYGGTLRFFWNVGRPFILDGSAYVPLIKVGQMGDGFFAQSEGVLLRSDDLFSVTDPAQATWETLPDGDVGLRAPPGDGPISEEQSYCVLSDSTIHCVYRSIDGHPVQCYSRDRGKTWTAPQSMRYADGRLIRHPRAANFAWRCRNGKYLYWFHNHGGRNYEDRNPAWLCAGVEIDSPDGKRLAWSQPEIVLYDDDPHVRMSYPDLIEDNGRYYLTETQKDIARVHGLDGAMLAGMWATLEASLGRAPMPALTTAALLETVNPPAQIAMPSLPAFLTRDSSRMDMRSRDCRAGFTIDLCLTVERTDAQQVILDSRPPGTARGLLLTTAAGGTLQITMGDGRQVCSWCSDPFLEPGRRHAVTIVVDGGPRIITFITDGQLHDGAGQRQFGWGRFSPTLYHANGATTLRVGSQQGVTVQYLRLYACALQTWQVISSQQQETTT